MKRIMTVLLLCLLCKVAVLAVLAYPKGHRVKQPDGSSIMLYAYGDEFSHVLATADGTIVAKDAEGFYRPTGEGDLKRAVRRNATGLKGGPYRITTPHKALQKRNFRGLVLLVNFTDQNFSLSDLKIHDYYNKIMNAPNLTSYNPTLSLSNLMTLTGSVRDYFYDNSNGTFVPEFDVVGPIKMDESKYYINGVSRTSELTEKVLRKADEQGVDFSKYDCDGDGEIDMVYIVYAGYASNYQGNDERLVWPHASTMDEETTGKAAPILDGKKMGRYACSAEIFGWHEEGHNSLDGIGTIVHEFSHVLGFMDHYDTSNGYQEHPNTWDVMSAGNYSDDLNRTPCGFNSYEKHVAGFCEPLDITEMAGKTIDLNPYETSTDACLIRSYQDHVSYFMENRQPVKWDKNLPGHGLLVWRVDSIRPEYWKYNYVNVTTRACFRLVRACGTQGEFLTGVVDTDYDSFPGTHGITELDNDDDAANLISYDGYPCPVVLRNISEAEGVVSFRIEADPYAENRPITYAIPAQLYGQAEKLIGEEWVPVTWTMTSNPDAETHQLYNFLPGADAAPVTFTYMEDVAHTVTINAQRVERTGDYSKWLCNFTNVDEEGAGVLTFTVGRYGVPEIDARLQLGYCTMKASSYVVKAKNILSRDVVYRNVRFTDTKPTGIDAVEVSPSSENASLLTTNSTCRKVSQGGRILLVRNGLKYSLDGRRIE